MKTSSMNRARIEAEMALIGFEKEYSDGASTIYLYDGVSVSGPEHTRVIGRVYSTYRDYDDEEPLLIIDGDNEEDFFIQYGNNAPIPGSVLPLSAFDYIKALMD